MHIVVHTYNRDSLQINNEYSRRKKKCVIVKTDFMYIVLDKYFTNKLDTVFSRNNFQSKNIFMHNANSFCIYRMEIIYK